MKPTVINPPYVCKECGKPVLIAPDRPNIWTCEHRGGTIIANMAAQVTAQSTTG